MLNKNLAGEFQAGVTLCISKFITEEKMLNNTKGITIKKIKIEERKMVPKPFIAVYTEMKYNNIKIDQ
ncbi:hypothetical protein GCM10007199_42700 [Fictibacillus barbaricus]|nr:hypothetical protein GCM10007199_42700 [Fictibacillus barbaricus]